MKKPIAVFAFALTLTSGLALAGDSSSSMSDNYSSDTMQSDSVKNEQEAGKAGMQKNEVTGEASSSESRSICTDAKGKTYQRGQKGFARCMKHAQSGGTAGSTTTETTESSSTSSSSSSK
jgi:hypothetical protein